MSETIIINIIEAEQQVTINVTELLGRDGEPGPAGDGYTHVSEDFTGSTSVAITLAHAYIPGSIRLFKNGARQNNASFTQSDTGIVLNLPRNVEDEFIIDYKY